MRQWPVLGAVVATLAAVIVSAAAESRVIVTAKDLIASNHRIEVDAGTEVIWGDPHIERVWFAPDSGIQVRRTSDGLTAAFPRPGQYKGRVTLVATHGTGAADVMPIVVIVKAPAR